MLRKSPNNVCQLRNARAGPATCAWLASRFSQESACPGGLDLMQNPIRESGVSVLVSKLRYLRKLNIGYCYLTEDAGAALAEAFLNKTKLEVLELGRPGTSMYFQPVSE